jgi:hypothetical protein
MTSAAADYPEHCLHEVWEQLTARGFVTDEPMAGRCCQCFIKNLRDACCEMDLLVTGALAWVYTPLAGISPHQATRLVLALLSTGPVTSPLPPARPPGLALKDAAAQMLAACGMMARPADIRYDLDEVQTEVIITNPADPARGHAGSATRAPSGGNTRSPPPAALSAGLPPRHRPGHRCRVRPLPGRPARPNPGQRACGTVNGHLTEAAS